MGVTVTSKDRGYDALMARMHAASKETELTVGIHSEEGAGGHGEISIIEIGEIHEYGIGLPARSFIGAWAEEREAEHTDQIRKLGESLVKGKVGSADRGMNQLGQKYVGEVQSRMAGGLGDPPRTLIDTGILRSSIAAKVSG